MSLRNWLMVAAFSLPYVISSGRVLHAVPTAQGTLELAGSSDSECDPNYAGGCVLIASDVDCAGGNGNGPAYVTGTVEVVGKDIYGLDVDHDGLGCEPYKG
jgi:hypothetical protein